ncbi:MAG TPA: trypsin-like peptidase domain-containing protein, partial [Nitrolancea sp.]|nr:trypsin-like peptidase domain-containing protein [Nitrolancea sp.]
MISQRFQHIGRRIPALVLVAVLATACTIGGGSSPSGTATSQATTNTTATANSTTSANSTADSNSTIKTSQQSTTASPSSNSNQQLVANSIINVVNTDKPAVVEITNEQTSVSQMDEPVPVGTGSGFIYDNQGHILTNNHVVEGAQSLVVTLPDGRTFKGNDVKVVGTDPQTDLAVLQITGSNLPAIQVGDSSQLQVGQWVVAVGYALGLEGQPTVTQGVVSAVNRSVQEPDDSSNGSSSNPFQQPSSTTAPPYLFDVIQTDAAINPGNSGGPLVNLDGQVVGINTLEAGEAEAGVQSQGIGFAIAINTAKKIANEIVTTGHATHPYVGIEYQPLSPAAAAQLNVTATQGALVESVVSGSPADTAGLQKGDIVTQIDGKDLTTDSAFAEAVDNHAPGDVVTLTVQRNGQTMSIKVT